jgi:hypothetical protein
VRIGGLLGPWKHPYLSSHPVGGSRRKKCPHCSRERDCSLSLSNIVSQEEKAVFVLLRFLDCPGTSRAILPLSSGFLSLLWMP